MPYNVQLDDVLEVSISMRQFEQRILSVFHYKITEAGAPVDGVALITAFDAEFNNAAAGKFLNAYAGCIHVSCSIQAVVYQWVSNTRRARVVKTPVITGGVLAGTACPPNVAAAITKRSETATRHGVSTLHMPALLIENIDLGRLTDPGKDLYDTLLPRLSGTITTGGGVVLSPVIFNRQNPVTSIVITAAQAQSTVRTMHRRTVGVGE